VPKPPLTPEAAEMFARPNYATLTALKPDGQTASAATWYLYDGARVLVNMDDMRPELRWLRADPRVTLTAIAPDDAPRGEGTYTHLSIQGHVAEFAADKGLRDIDRISWHYKGEPYPVRDRSRTSAWMDIDVWSGWGALKRA
jgi:hypothetical protein